MSRLRLLQPFEGAAYLRGFRVVGIVLNQLLQQVQRPLVLAFFVQCAGGAVVVVEDVFVAGMALGEVAGEGEDDVVVVMFDRHSRQWLDPVGRQAGGVVQRHVFHRLAYYEVAAFVALRGGFNQALFEGGQGFMTAMHGVVLIEAAPGREVLGDVFWRAGVGQQQRLHFVKAAFGLQGVGGEQVLRELFFGVVVHVVGVGFVQYAQLGVIQSLRGVGAHEVADVGVGERDGKDDGDFHADEDQSLVTRQGSEDDEAEG